MSAGWGIIGRMRVDTVFIVENGPGSGQSDRWAHVCLSMAKAKAGVAHWAAKAGHANLRWQDNTYTQAARSDSGELLYTIVHTEVRQDNDPEP
jgi:hypothetical protein